MKWAALILAVALGGATLASCEDTYGDYGYNYEPSYYHHDYYGRGYYDSYGYWHSNNRYCADPDGDCD